MFIVMPLIESSSSVRSGMSTLRPDGASSHPSAISINIALLTELASSIASVTIHIALLTELGERSTHNNQQSTGPGPRPLPPAYVSLPFEQSRRRINLRGQRLYGGDGVFRLRLDITPLLLLDGFTHARNRLHAIACVEARRVDLVLEPGAARQALLARQSPLGLIEQLVQRLHLLHALKAFRRRFRQRLFVTASAVRESANR